MEAALAARWRLILGTEAGKVEEALSLDADNPESQTAADRMAIDRALDFVYGSEGAKAGESGADLSRPDAYIPRWLDLVRSHFPVDTVSLMVRDAVERRGLAQLLLEPEALERLEPDPRLIATLLSLKDAVSPEARAILRDLVRRMVDRLDNRLRSGLAGAVKLGVRQTATRRGSYRSLDWRRTVRTNLRHYDQESKRMGADRFYFRSGERGVGEWRVIILVDQSGSMAESVVHAAVAAAILASMRSLRTHLVLFGSEVADMSSIAPDPVEVLMGAQIGGGTDIAGAVRYAADLVQDPARTLLVLVTDLYEGGDADDLVRRLQALNDSRCRTLCLLAVTGEGRADYSEPMAARLAEIGTPSFAAALDDLPGILGSLWGASWPPRGVAGGA